MIHRQYTTVGKVTRAQGNKGEVRILPFANTPENLLHLKTQHVAVGDPEEDVQVLTILRLRVHRGFVIARFAGIETRDAAEELAGATLYVRDNELWELEENEFFVHQLKELMVIDVQTETSLGTVKDVREGPAHDQLIIQTHDREFMLPLVKEFVRKIDLAEQKVFVKIPEGLLDV